jgi:hypothetical protein
MDVDATSMGDGDWTGWKERRGLNEAERKKRQTEGRCFLCGRQGHMRRACPKRKEDGGKRSGNPSRTERARAATTEPETGGSQLNESEQTSNGVPESPPAYDPDSLISHIKTLSINQRDELLDKLMEGDEGF